jgi:hypothetical protein
MSRRRRQMTDLGKGERVMLEAEEAKTNSVNAFKIHNSKKCVLLFISASALVIRAAVSCSVTRLKGMYGQAQFGPTLARDQDRDHHLKLSEYASRPRVSLIEMNVSATCIKIPSNVQMPSTHRRISSHDEASTSWRENISENTCNA